MGIWVIFGLKMGKFSKKEALIIGKDIFIVKLFVLSLKKLIFPRENLYLETCFDFKQQCSNLKNQVLPKKSPKTFFFKF